MQNNSNGYWPSTAQPDASRDIWVISDDAIKYVYTINMAILCFILSITGIVTNAINIVVFLHLGFQETINISLFGLAISDCCSLIALLFESICFNPYLLYSDYPIDFIALQHNTGGWTHIMFTRVTGFITVFITLERCLCITFPLTVKSILTKSKVKVIIIAIYVITIGSMVQNYCVSYIDWKWSLTLNRSILTVSYTADAAIVEKISWHLQIVYPLTTISLVTVCTAIFVWKLNIRGKWLQSATGKEDKSSAVRDEQIIKLVVSVAVIFIVCYIPSAFMCTAMAVMPEMNLGGKYERFLTLVASISFVTDALNSSVNIVVYYNMMSKYKVILISRCTKNKRQASTNG